MRNLFFFAIAVSVSSPAFADWHPSPARCSSPGESADPIYGCCPGSFPVSGGSQQDSPRHVPGGSP